MGRLMARSTGHSGIGTGDAPEGRAQATAGQRLGGVLRLLHPFPSLMNAVAVLLFAIIALGQPPDWTRTARLVLTMLAAQAAIGIANDLADLELDRDTKRQKPLISGLISATVARGLLLLALLLAASGAATFGLASFTLVVLGTGIGIAYDFLLKRTALSWLPYLLALPLAPIWVWTALDRFTPLLFWLYPLGATLFLALHLANALADFSGDTAAGVRGIVQRLGRRRAIGLLWGAALLPMALATGLGLLLPYRWERFGPTLALALLPLLGSAAITRRYPEQDAPFRTVFGLLICSTIILGAGWLGAAI